jgi:homoserine trans-succinylase
MASVDSNLGEMAEVFAQIEQEGEEVQLNNTNGFSDLVLQESKHVNLHTSVCDDNDKDNSLKRRDTFGLELSQESGARKIYATQHVSFKSPNLLAKQNSNSF